jgi:hypothetical protein
MPLVGFEPTISAVDRPMFYQLIVDKNTIFYDRKPEAATAV